MYGRVGPLSRLRGRDREGALCQLASTSFNGHPSPASGRGSGLCFASYRTATLSDVAPRSRSCRPLKAAAFIERQDKGVRPPASRHQEDLKASPPGVLQRRADGRFAIPATLEIRLRDNVLEKALWRPTAHQVGRRDEKAGRDWTIGDKTNHEAQIFIPQRFAPDIL